MIFDQWFSYEYNYRYDPYSLYGFSPANLLQNEWIVFSGILLVIFTFVYIALSKAFTRENKFWTPWDKPKKEVQGRVALTVVSFIISFFSASYLMTSGWADYILNYGIGIWLFLLFLIILFILGVPFFKALSRNIGKGPAAALIVLLSWFLLKFLFNPWNLLFYYNGFNWVARSPQYSTQLWSFYQLITSWGVLAILIVAGFVWWMINHSSNNNQQQRTH